MTAKPGNVQALIGKFGGPVSANNNAVLSRQSMVNHSSIKTNITASVSNGNTLSTSNTMTVQTVNQLLQLTMIIKVE